jgi:hypothetical protein
MDETDPKTQNSSRREKSKKQTPETPSAIIHASNEFCCSFFLARDEQIFADGKVGTRKWEKASKQQINAEARWGRGIQKKRSRAKQQQ